MREGLQQKQGHIHVLCALCNNFFKYCYVVRLWDQWKIWGLLHKKLQNIRYKTVIQSRNSKIVTKSCNISGIFKIVIATSKKRSMHPYIYYSWQVWPSVGLASDLRFVSCKVDTLYRYLLQGIAIQSTLFTEIFSPIDGCVWTTRLCNLCNHAMNDIQDPIFARAPLSMLAHFL